MCQVCRTDRMVQRRKWHSRVLVLTAEVIVFSFGTAAAAGSSAPVGYSDGAVVRTAVTGWSVVPSVDQSSAHQAELLSVTCLTANDCYAVGGAAPRSVAIGVGNVTRRAVPIAEHFDGRRWTTMGVPGVHGVLRGVSCSGRAWCVAVGGRFVRGGTSTLVERLVGKRWVRVATPRVTGMAVNDSSLNAVSCTSRSACVAVGQDVDATTCPRPGSPTPGRDDVQGALVAAHAGRHRVARRPGRRLVRREQVHGRG